MSSLEGPIGWGRSAEDWRTCGTVLGRCPHAAWSPLPQPVTTTNAVSLIPRIKMELGCEWVAEAQGQIQAKANKPEILVSLVKIIQYYKNGRKLNFLIYWYLLKIKGLDMWVKS